MTDGAGASLLRKLFARPGVIRLMGAHNALGARMAERAGFDGVWSSSFEISASYAVPDASILTESEHLAAARAMCGAVGVPVVADCDTGYGDGFQFARTVRRFESAGVAAVCIEDKQFPKLNSFAPGRQELVSIDEFVAKLRAGKQAQLNTDFIIIARVEALIAGCGREEALARARAYADAGADAVLVHSKSTTVDELAGVALAWDRSVPLVAVPTSYYRTTAEQLSALGVKMIIYANQGLRCALQAMEQAYAEILRSGSTASIEERLWPMKAIFEVQGVADDVEPVAANAAVQGASSES
jgi:phosphoenolpyruvate phosphomutase